VVCHLFGKFLEDRAKYAGAVDFWTQTWEEVDPTRRDRFGWQQPWLVSDWQKHPQFMDGNPIFSAWSPRERKGIRVIQYAPTSGGLEFDHWLDTFGGRLGDPDTVRTLTIACALSEEAAQRALELMNAWVWRDEISIVYPELLVRQDSTEFRRTTPVPFVRAGDTELAAV